MNELLQNTFLKFAIPGLLLFGLLWLSYAVLQDFLLIITWAIIIAYVMWPLYQRLKKLLDDRDLLSASVMTGLVSAFIGFSLFWLVVVLQNEVKTSYQLLMSSLSSIPLQLPDAVKKIPWLGGYLQQLLDQINADSDGTRAQLFQWARQWLGDFGRFLGGVGRNIVKAAFVLITLFFCFRDGDRILSQIRQGFINFLGEYQNIYLQAAGKTARAVVYGLMLASLGQGVVAGLGYFFAGVKTPVLFAALTALLAMIPMGATLIWMPVSLSLIFSGEAVKGTALFIWGIVAVSTIDNVIRPIVISGASRIPFLVVLFGVFGGLSAFGAVGLFLGPIVLSVLLAVWKAWLSQQGDSFNL